MSHAGRTREQHDQATIDDEGEISGVFERTPSFDIAVGVFHNDASAAPAPVYAWPFLMLGRARVPYPQGYYLGTRFDIGVIAADDWEEAMRADGMPEAMIVKCRAYIDAHAF